MLFLEICWSSVNSQIFFRILLHHQTVVPLNKTALASAWWTYKATQSFSRIFDNIKKTNKKILNGH